VADPHSRNYQHYLTPAQFNARFGPTAASVGKVRDFLSGEGLTVGATADGNRWVEASGTIGAFDRAFGTTVRTYLWKGRTLRAPSTVVTVPVALAGTITSLAGLDTSGALIHPFHATIARADVAGKRGRLTHTATQPKPTGCSSYWAQHTQKLPQAYGRTTFPTYLCGYDARQLRGAYGVDGMVRHGRDGHGVTVGIVDAYASPTMVADANTYAKAQGEPVFAKGQYAQTVFRPFTMQSDCEEPGWNSEQSLDVEAVHNVAPGAKIRYFGASDCDTGIDHALDYIVQHRAADLVSNSYGFAGEDVPDARRAVLESIFVQGAAEGIGFYFSSGDLGDEVTAGDTTSAQPSYPASSAMVTAVGGSSLAVTKADGYLLETGWGSAYDVVDYTGATAAYAQPLPGAFLSGSGGGTSTLYREPAYQKATVPTNLSRMYGNAAARVVPDVAAVADPYTGMLIGETIGGDFVYGGFGGTSLSCPVIAAVQAIASTGRAKRIGFANPLLYSLPAGAFHDIKARRTPLAVTTPTASALVTLDRDSTLFTANGYDNVTGRGTPVGPSFVAAEG
jgi:subtilase family serine protease